jgi:hypothetical protein
MAAGAVVVLLNNGLAPPEAPNVIDASDAYDITDGVSAVTVRNAGCTTDTGACPAPGDSTTVEMVAGGSVWELDVLDTSQLRVRGGTVNETLVALGSSQIQMSGGSVAHELRAADSAAAILSGGFVGGPIVAAHASRITIVGSGFAVGGAPIGDGPIAATTGLLTGTLASGDPIESVFAHAGYSAELTGTIVVVPEPGPGLLGAVALAAASAVARGLRGREGSGGSWEGCGPEPGAIRLRRRTAPVASGRVGSPVRI